MKITKLWQKLLTPELLLITLGVMIIHLVGAELPAAGAKTLALAESFSPPLGYRDGMGYGPRIRYNDQGQLIENTDYGIKNPDLQGGTCFGINFDQIYHAGEDWYREDGRSTAGAEVTAVANGQVLFADPEMNYPGLVVIIKHQLPSGRIVYSMYAHLDDFSLEVEVGQQVSEGQRLGTVMYRDYTGRYPEYHPSGDDSHLHFEIRNFYNARNIYPPSTGCNGLIAGRGYTYPQHPDDFPFLDSGYVDPFTFIQEGGANVSSWMGDE